MDQTANIKMLDNHWWFFNGIPSTWIVTKIQCVINWGYNCITPICIVYYSIMNSSLRTVFAGTAPAAKVLAAFDMFFHVQSSEGFRLQIRTFRSHFCRSNFWERMCAICLRFWSFFVCGCSFKEYGVSINWGSPKGLVYNEKSIYNWMIWGYSHFSISE